MMRKYEGINRNEFICQLFGITNECYRKAFSGFRYSNIVIIRAIGVLRGNENLQSYYFFLLHVSLLLYVPYCSIEFFNLDKSFYAVRLEHM